MFMSLPVSAIDAVPGIIGVLAVTSAIGYVGVAINAVRRLRSGECGTASPGVTTLGRPLVASRLEVVRHGAWTNTYRALMI
jgi:hypothetical protein